MLEVEGFTPTRDDNSSKTDLPGVSKDQLGKLVMLLHESLDQAVGLIPLPRSAQGPHVGDEGLGLKHLVSLCQGQNFWQIAGIFLKWHKVEQSLQDTLRASMFI